MVNVINKTRSGETVVSSVSISKEFKQLIEDNNISSTSAFRKGIAIELYERGLIKYQTQLNEERSKGIIDFMNSIDKLEELERNRNQLIEDLKLYDKTIIQLLGVLE